MSLHEHAERTTTRDAPIIEVRNLQTAFFTEKETIRAVDGISFDIRPGETVGIVGESGSGKSVTARSLMRLVDAPGRILEGSSVRFTHLETVREYASTFAGRTVDLSALEETYDPVDLFERNEIDATPAAFGYEHAHEVSLADIVAAGYGDELGIVDEGDCIFITDGTPDSPDAIADGFIEITRLSGEAQRRIRGGRIAMVFQDPLTSLNPVYTVGNQIKEALRLHQGIKGDAATREATALLEAVGIPDARRRVNEYPHQFSGGMRQRAVIAMALACDPELLICDEPTTALDVTIQAQILDLLAELQETRDLAMMFITHDMGVIAEIADRVNVMYAGEVVETADVNTLFADPSHPYTRGLLRSIPGQQTGDRLETIEGNVPTPNEPATSCRFAPRCPEAIDECETVHPVSVPVDEDEPDHTAACLHCPTQLSTDQAVEMHRRRNATRNGGDLE
ncbi:ABC transporter ATP-binding protein [Natronorubrum sulfidifaciens]|uniref:Nickel import system ATP-binding protein NikD n=1 Tax=Natronorubrum sulfidifaciens JCM 14089 TaxID=1230460 RepID=L9W4W5_9EURY|nr:ABC transporter ATP-binding protein [Natronorubrum sulfidifaciens]ELY44392.1 oligopeptide/dipeptide ABC transporter ATPase [Natronorubrum sulfidifaciens JCM 14089]